MCNMWKICIKLLVFLVFYSVRIKCADIDVTLFDKNPLVSLTSSDEYDYRAYVSWSQNTATYVIGRSGYTGTGEVGVVYDAQEVRGNDTTVPEGHGFPAGTKTRYHIIQSKNHVRLDVKFSIPSSTELVGVFYVATNYKGLYVTLSTVKLSKTANIKPVKYTETTSIGDSVTLRMNVTVANHTILRWKHNNGSILANWNGQTSVTIDNVRLADAGIYECYEEGKRQEGQHSIMILIVRPCPGPKYGTDCTQDCPTCWNGGQCEAETGRCVCPPGFKGDKCQNACTPASNKFGAECSIHCGGDDKTCKGALMRPPDPVGLKCVAGYMGLDCKQECPSGKYGANCERDCNCVNCDKALGCHRQTRCKADYGGTYPKCQAPETCANGFFGMQCEYLCHCDGNGSCDKSTGVCANGKCAAGWAGSDCQQVLPALTEAPTIDVFDGLNFHLSWEPWNRTRDYGVGPVEKYRVQCWESKNGNTNSLQQEFTTDLTTVIITLPTFETSYTCGISVLKLVDTETVPGPIGPTSSGTTKCGKPLRSPTFADNIVSGTDFVALRWSVPEGSEWIQCSDGIDTFNLSCAKYGTSNLTTYISVRSPDRTFEVVDLTPCTNYTFIISVVNSYSSGPSANVTIETLPSEPLPPVSGSVQLSAAVIVPILLLIALILIVLLVIIIKRRRTREESDNSPASENVASSLGNLNQTTQQSLEVAIQPTIELVSPKPSETNEDGDKLQGQVNAAITTQDVVYANVSDLNVVKPKSTQGYVPNTATSIQVVNLLGYVKRKKRNSPDNELILEHQSLSNVGIESSTSVASKEVNKEKNRYKNIITYDHSRVILQQNNDDPDTDYINASYIDGYQKPNAFIAAQGPNKETLVDMWRMIWQEKSRAIVMVTNLKEGAKRKCQQYWPAKGQQIQYGDVMVENINEISNKDFTVRTFQVDELSNSGNATREIKHFHYTGWPDMNVPEHASPVLQFLDEVNKHNPDDAGPIVVHCSAGVGRTGTFIAIDTMRKMAEDVGKMDVLGYATYMRTRRSNMIQTEHQYVFVFETLLEAAFCGTTVLDVKDIKGRWDDFTDEGTLQGQLETLQALFPEVSADLRTTGGLQPENAAKNRFSEYIPDDSSRTYLMTIDHGGSNYINASFYDGHSKKAMFIATQIPLPNTIGDFWAMVYDYKCYTIVALNDPLQTDQTCGQYLPTDGNISCGLFTLDVLNVDKFEKTIETRLRLRKKHSKIATVDVTHIQYSDWQAGSGLPNSSASFAMLMDRAERSYQANEDQRIAVMCMNGVDRCGMLCALFSITNQIKDTQQISAFQAVKKLKKTRPNVMNSLEQYRFCLQTAHMYVKSNATYANFL